MGLFDFDFIHQSESQVRCETMNTLCNLLECLGAASSACHKEIYKAAKTCMTDRVPSVRASAAKCMNALAEHHAVIHGSDLEATVSLCLRCMDCSNYTVRFEAARLLGHTLARTQNSMRTSGSSTVLSTAVNTGTSTTGPTLSRSKTVTLQDAMNLLASGFLKGPGGFLKGTTAGDMIKGTNSVNREVRTGVTYAYVEFFTILGPECFETNLASIIAHCTNLLANTRATPTHAEAIYARNCVGFILGTLYRRLLSEPVQLVAARELVGLLRQRLQFMQSLDESNGPATIGLQSDANGLGDSTLEGQDCMTESTQGEDMSESFSSGSFADQTSSSRGTTDADSGLGRRGFGRTGSRAQRQKQQQQHVIISIMDQLTQLLHWLDSLSGQLLEPPIQLPDLLCSALGHSSAPVRLAAASCLRQLTLVLPSQRTVLLDRCISSLQQAQRTNADTILGYSSAIAGILAGASVSTLGIPANRLRQVFTLSDELLRAANQNSRLTLPRTQAGWTLLAACMTLGPDLVKPHLPKMLLFWRNAFPRSARELEAEKQRGDAFTWQIMLESRAGALCSMQSFLECCSSVLTTEEAIRRLLAPIECALSMLTHMLDIVRIYGNHLKAAASLIRHRLYRILLLLPPTAYTMFLYHLRQSGIRQQGSYSTLLRELVAEFTLTDNAANTTTSLLRWMCRTEDSVTLGCWVHDTDHKLLEEQLQPNGGNTPGALEHDPAYLFLRDGLIWATNSVTGSWDTPGCDLDLTTTLCHSPSLTSAVCDGSSLLKSPLYVSGGSYCSITGAAASAAASSMATCAVNLYGPLPVSVAVIDSAVELFARIFPCVPVRHRTQMMEHFAECIRLTKSTRQEAVQINVFTALLGAMRRLTENKAAFGDDAELRKSTANLILTALTSPSVLLRCSAGECLGRLAQVVAEPNFLTELAQQIFDRLRTVRIPVARSGHCLAVGCLHRYVGGLASGQHLNTSVGVLLAIAQDSSVPEVQVWALHALALVADSGGPMFREYVEPSLNLVLQLLLRSPTTVNEIQRSLGRLLAALITTLGPELQSTGPQIVSARHSCLLCCRIMQDSSDVLLQAEAVNCLQRLHMFAAPHAHLVGLLPELQVYLSSPHLLLRRAAVSYMRQISQKEADKLYISAVPEIASPTPTGPKHLTTNSTPPRVPLELQLFNRLDVETDLQTRRDIEEILLNMLHSSAHSRFSLWLCTLKEVLQATTVDKTTRNTLGKPSVRENATSTDSRPNVKDSRDQSSPSGHVNALNSTASPVATISGGPAEEADEADEEDADVDITLGAKNAVASRDARIGSKMTSRWSTRVFAVACVRILISACARAAQMAATAPHSTLISLPRTTVASRSITCQEGDLVNPDEDVAVPSSTPQALLSDPNSTAHFDLALARRLRQSANVTNGPSDWLILHLTDLIRMAFMSATSDCEPLRMAGLRLMREVIQHFASVPDPDCAGHIILEQYQAQVSAALRPAFSFNSTVEPGSGTPKSTSGTQPSPELTAVACQVCSMWIGSGVARDTNDLQRVHELLRRAFDKLQLAHLRPCLESIPRNSSVAVRELLQSNTISQLYCEDAVTMEQLAVLRSWADVYIVTMRYRHLSGRIQSRLNQDQSVGVPAIALEGQSDTEDEDDESDAKEVEEDDIGDELFRDEKQRLNDDYLVTMTLEDNDEHLKLADRTTRRHYRHTYRMLLNLVRPVISSLAQAWIGVLQDFALLTLPDELASQRPVNGGTFYGQDANIDRVRVYYTQHWSAVTHALSLWLQNELFVQAAQTQPIETLSCGKYFHLLLGLCIEALSSASEKQSVRVINTCLRALWCLLSRPVPRSLLMRVVPEMPVELLSVLYRLMLTRDTIQTHLLCLQNVSQVLIAAEERLVKQREIWLSKDSTSEQPRPLLTPDAHGATNGINMVSSVMLQTTSLVDAEMYELAEGGSLANFPDTQEVDGTASEHSTKNIIPSIGLQPGRSIVFAALEIVMCVVARYRPSLFAQLRASEATKNGLSTTDLKNTVPEARCPDSPDAPFVLATAVRCCTFVPDLCAPSLLLSTLDLIPESRAGDSGTPSKSTRLVGKDNLLPVFLDLVVQLAQISLIQPSDANLSTGVGQPSPADRVNRPDPTDLPELQSFMSSGSWSNKDDNEISSTTAYSSTGPTNTRRRHQAHERRQHRLIRWTWQQVELAGALSSLVQKLAQHHYPALASSTCMIRDGEKLDEVSGKTRFGQVQPDSSSCNAVNGKQSPHGTNLSTGTNAAIFSTTYNPPADKRAQAAAQWYELVSIALWKLLRHEHSNSGESHTISSCCFSSVSLVSRMIADCPARVLQYEPLRGELCSRVCQLWSQAGQRNAARVIAGGSTSSGAATAWTGLTDRYVCMVAISSLINHRNPVVSAFFVRTLTPQIFRWLYDLSCAVSESDSINPIPPATPISRDDLTNTLHLAMELLESVIDLSDAASRPNLLVILVPLWCSLLCPNPPSAAQIHQWTNSVSHCLPYTAEIACGVHLITLQHLVALAPRFPTEFRSVFCALGFELRTRLERAIRQSHGASSKPNKLVPNTVTSTDFARPVIQLKTDFSGFDK
ncbi:HEAT repeat-containing protein [Fasciola hepatica]|uniref:HEAT repeat-containing protein n=1 Tax=Fasciola hepatica TaxID=6192 RepID=A0A4E0RT41_FASHE|nr:HEAT repeat-containing protein [Fasciola hepatica]